MVTAPIAYDIDATLRVTTYNCRGLSDNRISTIKELVSINDILFIQEHWLYEEQLHKLNICDIHMSIAVFSFHFISFIQPSKEETLNTNIQIIILLKRLINR